MKDHESIKNFMLYHSTNLIHSILSFFVFGFILYIFSFKVFAVYFSCIICYIIWVISFKKYQENIETGSHNLHNQNNNFWIETARNNAEIRSNNLEAYHRKKWEEIQIAMYHQDISSAKIRNRQEVGSHIINGIKNILITFICAKSVVNGNMTFGVFISIQFIVGFLNSPIHQFIAFIQAYPNVKQSFLRLSEIYRNNFESQNFVRKVIGIPQVPQSIVFNKVYFKYEDSSGFILKDINIVIPYGKTVAIVGRSGSGKSSLINLMLGLFKPNDGNLYIGKFLFYNIDQVQWREHCGVVLQNGKIFNDSIFNNIVLKDNEPDYVKFDRIVEMVELKDLIQDLPQGYFSAIGEKGRKLSHGQKQRILLARALYKEPDYLFLDEATSALDVFNEAVILKRIIRYMENKTLIIATHRINTIQNADHIIVMNDGMIIEQGVHDSLINKKGIYHMMCSLHDTNNQKN